MDTIPMTENPTSETPSPDAPEVSMTANFDIGPSAITAYSRLSYTMWYALAEFIDNSTQSRENYEGIIDAVLAEEGNPLRVEINYDPTSRELTIADNSIGMTHQDLVDALKIASPTKDSKGRSKYGMGLKTAACWMGHNWSVTTCEWPSGEEWTATVSVDAISKGNQTIPLSFRKVDSDQHYTVVKVANLNRIIQKRTEETIMSYLGSMYRMDIRAERLIILFNGKQVPLPEEWQFARYDTGTEVKVPFETTINGKSVRGWFGVLQKGSRKFGGFSIFQNNRQIKGYPDAWKPRSVFGGVDEEGSNTLVSQRLVGEIILDGFEVSHTKDDIVWQSDEYDRLEEFLIEKTQELKRFALSMRKGDTTKTAWDRERLKEIMEEAKEEFGSTEFRDVVTEASLPPLEVIQQANQRQAEALSEEDMLLEIPNVGAGIRVRVAFQDRSENDPHLSFVPDESGITVIINQQHPYYAEIDSADRVKEIVFQYVYDAVSEFRVGKRLGRQEPDAVRKLKDQLLRSKIQRMENKDAEHGDRELAKVKEV
ncbi:MAG TPA: ATP-binding protein [Pyrinomonadaceae bacterium]|nr:ATP-binding protein [Pyrinomonadaceae bacterium]